MRLIVYNAANQALELTGSTKYALTDATGLSPAVSAVNLTKYATMDGSALNSMSIESRNIVLTVYPLPPIEANRIDLYKWFTPKSHVRLRYISGGRDMSINGYVESFEGTFFERTEVFEISILCPEPYFLSSTPTTESGTYLEGIALTNGGDVECGFDLSVNILGDGTALELAIGNSAFTVVKAFENGDILTLCTRKGHKSVKLNGASILNAVESDSEWLQIPAGSSTLTMSLTGQAMLDYTLSYTPMYAGG